MYSGNAVVSWQFSWMQWVSEWTCWGRHLCRQKFDFMLIVDIFISQNTWSRYLIIYFVHIWAFVSAETIRWAFFTELFFCAFGWARSVARVTQSWNYLLQGEPGVSFFFFLIHIWSLNCLQLTLIIYNAQYLAFAHTRVRENSRTYLGAKSHLGDVQGNLC